MTDGTRILTIPRHDPVNAFTMGGIVRDAGLTVEEFKVRVSAHREHPFRFNVNSHFARS